MSENLWGEIPKPEKKNTPLLILKKQASLLGDLTEKLLEGEVKIIANSIDNIQAELRIVAPTLGGYSIGIIHIAHKLEFYPITVVDMLNNKPLFCPDEKAYTDTLKIILGNEKVKNVIGSLLTNIESNK